jgi:MFS family permease
MTDTVNDSLEEQSIDVADVRDEATEGLTKAEISHNFKFCIMLDVIYATGAVELGIALQPLEVYLGASNTLIGILNNTVAVLAFVGLFLSPYISAKFPVKKKLFYGTNVAQYIWVGIMGLAVLLSRQLGLSNPQLLGVIAVSMVAYNLVGGFVGLPHQEYTAAVIPTSYRGRFNGLSNGLGNTLSLLSNALGLWMLLHYAKPMSFAYLLLVSWFICQASFTLALFAVERPVPSEVQPSPWSREMLRAAWNDKPWIRVILMSMGHTIFFGGTLNFAQIYCYKVLHMNMANAAGFSAARLAIGILVGTWAGFLADKYGPRRILSCWWFGPGIAMGVVAFWPTAYGIYAGIILWAIWQNIWGTAQIVAYYGIPKPEHRRGQFTLQMIGQTIAFAIAGPLIGFLCDKFGFRHVFVGTFIGTFLYYPFVLWTTSILPKPPIADVSIPLPEGRKIVGAGLGVLVVGLIGYLYSAHKANLQQLVHLLRSGEHPHIQTIQYVCLGSIAVLIIGGLLSVVGMMKQRHEGNQG